MRQSRLSVVPVERRALEAHPEDVQASTQVIDNTRGILAMSASVVVFIFNDALIKLAAETMPPVQAIGLRGSSPRCGACWRCWRAASGGRSHRMRHPLVVLRGVLEAAAAISYLVALCLHPLRDRHRDQSVDAARSSPRWRCCC